MTKPSPFSYFKTPAEIIRLAVMLYVRFPLYLRNVEDLLHKRGIDASHETIQFWWHRFGTIFAAVYASIHNHFNQERHLYNRANFKPNRTAALAEWHQLCAVVERQPLCPVATTMLSAFEPL